MNLQCGDEGSQDSIKSLGEDSLVYVSIVITLVHKSN